MNAIAIAMRNAQAARASDALFREPASRRSAPRRRGPTVLIAVADPTVGAAVSAVVGAAGFAVTVPASSSVDVPAAVSSGPDLLITDHGLRAKLPAGPTRGQLPPVPVILLSTDAGPTPAQCVFGPVMAVLPLPLAVRNLLPAVEFALARDREIRSLRSDLAGLVAKLTERSSIDQAKRLLLERHGMTEPEAYRWLQRTAMNHRTSLAAVAGKVIDELTALRVPGQRSA